MNIGLRLSYYVELSLYVIILIECITFTSSDISNYLRFCFALATMVFVALVSLVSDNFRSKKDGRQVSLLRWFK